MGEPESPPHVPRYGEASLADLLPSLLSALGLEGFRNPLRVETMTALCMVVVDGLGWVQIREHPHEAPFLSGLADRSPPLTAGYPSTTSASLGSLGTGLPPGQHGLVGYTFAVPGYERPMNSLLWRLYGIGPDVDLRDRFPPEEFQPAPTLIERAEAAGLQIVLVGPPEHAQSPLTRAILRGGRYEGAHALDEVVELAARAMSTDARVAVYAYHPFLDTTGHLRGVGSDEWRDYLSRVDTSVAALAARLSPGAALVVTGDHGMIDIPEEGRVDVEDRPELLAGVRMLAGEARARHVHTRPGAETDVMAIWREVFDERMWVLTRDEAVTEGWFGPVIARGVEDRIGDVVAAARDSVGVFQRSVDPLQASLVGHHGSLTPAEQLVPFVQVRG